MARHTFDRDQQVAIDAAVRQITEEVTKSDLPGKGLPIPDIDQPYKPDWWIRNKLRRENISVETEGLRVRRQVERMVAELHRLPNEAAVRRHAAAINSVIRQANRSARPGPAANLAAVDVERAVDDWRQRHG